jgi:amino acid transporter
VGALSAFALLHASVIGYFLVRRKGRFRPAHAVVPVAGALVTLWVLVEASTPARIAGLLWLLMGLAVIAVSHRWPAARPASNSR